jgi:hypothetical protein
MDFGERLKKVGLSYGFHLLAPFPGTEVREQNNDYDINILTNDWSQYHANRAIVETPAVNRKMLDDIAADWENEYNGYLEDIKQCMRNGRAKPDEIWEVKNLERIVLIYDLMMQNVIEEKGSWHTNKNPLSNSDALKTLVSRINNSTTAKSEDILEALQYTAEQGNLSYSVEGAQVRWKWVDAI